MELLTSGETQLMDDISKVWGGFLNIIGHGVSREGDVNEACIHIHALQNMVLAQAAARAYPTTYRLMGEQPW